MCKLLSDSAKVDRVNKKRVSLLHDKLKIDDTIFVWDDTRNERVALPKQRDATR